MRHYLTFDTLAEFNDWHDSVNMALGYPNIMTKTACYTRAADHPITTQVCCLIDEHCPISSLEGLTEYDEIDIMTLGWVL